MSQVNVERVIGVLATDEGLRRRFKADPTATLHDMIERGMELTDCERWAISRLDSHELERFADAIDARLQKTEWREVP
jgi:hypothetical protein